MGSSDESDAEDDAAGLQAQVAQMLGPVQSRMKKATKKIDKLEGIVEALKKLESDHLPSVKKELTTGAAELASRLERVQAEVANLASKTQLEIVRQEARDSEVRLKATIDEERSKSAAAQLIAQGLEARVDAMERAMRASELKVGSELSASVAQLSQLGAALERQRGEADAKMSEASSRMSSQHDALLARLSALEEGQRTATETLATKPELAELAATVNRRKDEAESGVQGVREQWRTTNEALEAVRTQLARDYVTGTSFEALERRVDGAAAETRRLVSQVQSGGEQSRADWEAKLLQRQHSLEVSATEARRDWHRLSAQLETVQNYVTDRALRSEHEQLKAAVDALTSAAATKEELEAVQGVAKAASKASDMQVLEAEVRALGSAARADAANAADRFSRVADAAAFASLEETVASMQQQIESKFSQQEAQFALGNKLDRTLGEQVSAEVEAMQQRLGTLNDRANEAELSVSRAGSDMHAAQSQMHELHSQLSLLNEQHETMQNDSRSRVSDIHDLVKAVRALTADAEMRCSLDEREIEFLWAAPTEIYGQHGWRPNNGSQSERTPYPVGNFKMAVRHGAEGNARDVLTRRKKWLNSITLGKRAMEEAEGAAMEAGGGQGGAPVRLPALDEYARFKGRASRPETPSGGILGPAHALLDSHPSTLGGGVGLGTASAKTTSIGSRARVVETTV